MTQVLGSVRMRVAALAGLAVALLLLGAPRVPDAVDRLTDSLATASEPRSVEEIRSASADLGEELTFVEAADIRLAEESTYARDVSETRRTLLAAVAGLVGLVLAGLTGWRTTTLQGQLNVARESQVTDTFTKAIEQLGTRPENGDGLEVRLGGIYTLERIAKTSKADRPTVAEVLGAFVRANAGPISEAEGQPPTRQPTDVQAALTVIGRFAWHGKAEAFDLTGADLRWANLIDANLVETRLAGADLTHARLNHATLTRTVLAGARLTHVDLSSANVRDAYCPSVDLSGTVLFDTDLSGATLDDATLDGAFFDGSTVWPDGFDPPAAA